MARLRRPVKLNRMDATSGKTGKLQRRWGAVAFGCLLVALAACGQRAGAVRPPQAGDTAAATVDGQTVWASDVRREAAAEGLIGEGDRLDVASPLFRQALDQVIDQKLLAGEAIKRNLADDPQARRRLAAARERILGDMLVESLVAKTVSEGSIRGLYDEERKLSKPADAFHARQIVMASRAEAQAVKTLLADGGSFKALAMQRSVDAATRFNGGDLGYFTADEMAPAYAAVLKSAKAGDLIGPFQTDAGWVILQVEDRRLQPPVSLDAARPQIVRFLTYNEVRDLLERLHRRSQIKLLIPSPPAAAASSPVQTPKTP